MNNKLILILLLAAGSMTAMYGQTDYKKEADVCLKKGDYDCAQRNLKAYNIIAGINVDEELKMINSCITLLNAADALLAKQSYAAAETEYRKILELNPVDEAVKQKIEKIAVAKLLKEADALYEKQFYAEAKMKYEKYLEQHPDDRTVKQQIQNIAIAVLHNEADALYEKQLYAATIEKYNEILKLTNSEDEYAGQRIEEIKQIMDNQNSKRKKTKPVKENTKKIAVEPSQVRDSKMALGVNLLFPVILSGGDAATGFGIGAKALYHTGKRFRLAGAFDYNFMDGYNRWNVGLYGHYLFRSGKSTAFYPLVGVGMEGVNASEGGANYSLSNAAVSFGGGAEFGLSSNILLNIELAYRLNITDEQSTITYSGYSYDVSDLGNSGVRVSAGLIFRF